MPRLYADAPDLAISPDGMWVAELSGTSLRLYDLGRGSPPDAAPSRLSPIAELERPSRPGRIVFLSDDRLLHLWQVAAEGENGEDGHIAAELFAVPTLSEAGRSIRVPGCSRILGVGPAGAVVAPSGPGADIIAPRGNELTLHRTFIRGEVISAIAAPERRFLMEQRGGFELWDPQARKALARLVLNTRQVSMYLGFAMAGRMLWAVTGTIPLHVEVFRASDGRRLFELDQPGRALQADAGPGRLLVAVEERETIGLLDFDLGARALRRVNLPDGHPRPRSFVVNPQATASEVLVLMESDEDPLLRLSLPRPLTRAAPPEERTAITRPPTARPVPRGARPDTSTRSLRQSRPETRLIRRATSPAPEEEADDEAFAPSVRPALRSTVSPLLAGELDPGDGLLGEDDAAESPEGALVVASEAESRGERTGASEPARSQQREMLSRVFDPRKSPAAWQWELARWAQTLLLATSSTILPSPPEGGPLAALGLRLRLSPIAQKVLGFLYAAQSLLGNRPRGMRPIELAQYLGPLHEEPAVLAELLPMAPLRVLDLMVARADGRVQLRREVVAYLLGAPCPEVIPGAGSGLGREPLMPGLYLVPGVFPQRPQQLIGQPLVRVDGLREPQVVPTLARALRRAQLYDAAVIVDGIAGLSFPAFTSDGGLPLLRALLVAPKVPILLCAIPEAPAALGLTTRALALPPSPGERPAPLLPSAPLPLGTTWRAPSLPAVAVTLPDKVHHGRLEHLMNGDRRAAIVVSASATPDAYAGAAYLAARDGTLLVLDAELTTVRALVLGMLLRQLPVAIAAIPPAGPGTPWPPALQPFAQPLSARP